MTNETENIYDKVRRDHIAAAALQGILSNYFDRLYPSNWQKEAAKYAVQVADELILQLDKKRKTK